MSETLVAASSLGFADAFPAGATGVIPADTGGDVEGGGVFVVAEVTVAEDCGASAVAEVVAATVVAVDGFSTVRVATALVESSVGLGGGGGGFAGDAVAAPAAGGCADTVAEDAGGTGTEPFPDEAGPGDGTGTGWTVPPVTAVSAWTGGAGAAVNVGAVDAGVADIVEGGAKLGMIHASFAGAAIRPPSGVAGADPAGTPAGGSVRTVDAGL